MSPQPPPAVCDVVVVGGGILGLSAAWHLVRRGAGRVVVLERLRHIAGGSTPRAAALLSRWREDDATAAMVRATYNAVAALELELADSLGLISNGAVYVAGTPETTAALAGQMVLALARGDRVESLNATAAAERLPWLDAAVVDGAFLMPDDGFIDPYRLAGAYGTAARLRGASIHCGYGVTGFDVSGGRVTGVVLDDGATVRADAVVVAGGVWTAGLLATAEVAVGMAPVRSQYWITAADPAFPRRHPSAILPDAAAYSRPELGSLLFGLREAHGFAADAGVVPADLSELDLDDGDGGLAVLEAGWPALSRFCPRLNEVGIAHYVSGPCAYTVDGMFILGNLPQLPGVVLATGCCGAGIAASAGIGQAAAALAVGDAPGVDLSAFAPDRFGPLQPLDPAIGAVCAARRSAKRHG